MTAPARHLILVKHAAPTVVPGVPAAEWALSDAGRAAIGPLAARLAHYRPALLAASVEPKARETAERLATALGYPEPPTLDPDLREHARRAEDFFPSHDAFEAAVRDLFARPDALVFGAETGAAALARFDAAIARALAVAPPSGDVVVVAHGTVISLFAAARAGLAPFPLWRSLGLPSFVALTLPGLHWVETVGTVGG